MLVLNLALAAMDCPVIDVHQLHKVYAGLPSVPVDRRKGTHLRDRHATRPLCVHLPHSLLIPVLATSELLYGFVQQVIVEAKLKITSTLEENEALHSKKRCEPSNASQPH
jgi:hypothetical protein